MRGGVVPERIIEWYETLHLIDQSQVTSVAILKSAPAANQSLRVSDEETDTGNESDFRPTLDEEYERAAYLKEIATEVIRGVKAVLPTSNRFSTLEPCTDSVAQ